MVRQEEWAAGAGAVVWGSHKLTSANNMRSRHVGSGRGPAQPAETVVGIVIL